MDQAEADAGEAILEFAEVVKDDLDAALDGLAWRQNRPVLRTARSGPGQDAPTDRHYTFGVSRPLDEDEWDRAIAIVAAHARRVGYTGAALVVDRLQDHEVQFFAEDGRVLTFGTASSTIFRVSVTAARVGPVRPPSGGGGDGGAGRERAADATPPRTDRSESGPEDHPGGPSDDLPAAEPDIIDEVPRW